MLKWPVAGCFSSPLKRNGKEENRSQDYNQPCLHRMQGENIYIHEEQKERHPEDGTEKVLSPMSYSPASQGGKIVFSEILHIAGNSEK